MKINFDTLHFSYTVSHLSHFNLRNLTKMLNSTSVSHFTFHVNQQYILLCSQVILIQPQGPQIHVISPGFLAQLTRATLWPETPFMAFLYSSLAENFPLIPDIQQIPLLMKEIVFPFLSANAMEFALDHGDETQRHIMSVEANS